MLIHAYAFIGQIVWKDSCEKKKKKKESFYRNILLTIEYREAKKNGWNVIFFDSNDSIAMKSDHLVLEFLVFPRIQTSSQTVNLL